MWQHPLSNSRPPKARVALRGESAFCLLCDCVEVYATKQGREHRDAAQPNGAGWSAFQRERERDPGGVFIAVCVCVGLVVCWQHRIAARRPAAARILQPRLCHPSRCRSGPAATPPPPHSVHESFCIGALVESEKSSRKQWLRLYHACKALQTAVPRARALQL